MIVGERIKAIRESKGMSQGDIQKCTGLLRAYISRVENGHTVPTIETLEKIARAMDAEVYQIFFQPNGYTKPQGLDLPEPPARNNLSGKDPVVSRLARLVSQMGDREKKLLLGMAQKLAAR